jgi:hypothetical protein
MCRDFQRQRVYDWQHEFVPQGQFVSLDQARALVEYIWKEEGYEFPPAVREIPKQTRKWAGNACRSVIHLSPVVSTQTVIHEVTHSLLMDMDNGSDDPGHGELFMGLYMQLLSKYMRIPMFEMMYTANKEGVKFDITAKPIIED